MFDFRHIWNPDSMSGDWQIVGGDLDTGGDLTTAVVISLFSNRVAGPDDPLPDGYDDRQGWWGDTINGRPIGSKLWLLRREKATAETLNRARDYCKEALQWLLEDEVASRVDIDCQWNAGVPSQLNIAVKVWRQAGGNPVELSFAWAWKEVR
jgi:phage gp46-like protein